MTEFGDDVVREMKEAFATKPEAALVHPMDAARVQDEKWLRKFLVHCDGDVPLAASMLADTIAWRNQLGANDISEATLNLDYLRAGLFYPRGRDNDDCTLLVFKTKKNVKGQRNFDQVMRCLVYWMDRLDRVHGCDRISVFFDMEDTGLSHMDMEFTKYIIGLFKHYYPDFLNYIFIYEMPWVLTAAFKIIKTLLPAKAVAKLKFISGNTISQFIPPEHVHASWGGQDDYVFSFVPLADTAQDVSAKKVTFAEPDSPTRDNPEDDRKTGLVSVTPKSVIVFKRENDETSSGFTVANSADGPVAFKVRTTAPDKIKVSPSSGSLSPGESSSVKITLYSTHALTNPTVSSIKFLIVATAVERAPMPQQELLDLWKNIDKLKIEQHRLRCSAVEHAVVSRQVSEVAKNSDTVDSSDGQISALNRSIAGLKANNDQLSSQMKTLKTIQLVNVTLSALLLYLIVYFFRNVQFPERCGDFYNNP